MDVSTGSEKETVFFIDVTVGVVVVFFMILVDDGVETEPVLVEQEERERNCPFVLLGTMMSDAKYRNRLLSVRPRAAAVA